jgi:hypothetical protein
MIQTKVQESS